MTFVHKAPGDPRSIAILAGAFNPPTKAHVGLASSALEVVDEVLLAIPQSFPHKQFEGATLEQRIEMMARIAERGRGLSVAIAQGGLFAEIAREAREHYPNAEILLLCGRDAAERILTWDYGDPNFVDQMLSEFGLLVAPRMGPYQVPDRFRHAVQPLAAGDYDDFSSTRLREFMATGGDWRSLAPETITDLIERFYL